MFAISKYRKRCCKEEKNKLIVVKFIVTSKAETEKCRLKSGF